MGLGLNAALAIPDRGGGQIKFSDFIISSEEEDEKSGGQFSSMTDEISIDSNKTTKSTLKELESKEPVKRTLRNRNRRVNYFLGDEEEEE